MDPWGSTGQPEGDSRVMDMKRMHWNTKWTVTTAAKWSTSQLCWGCGGMGGCWAEYEESDLLGCVRRAFSGVRKVNGGIDWQR